MAKRRPALRKLHAAFRENQVEKRYLALLCGRWPHGAVVVGAALRKQQLRGGERMVVIDDADGKDALSRFQPLDVFSSATFVEVSIETGRTHQIRVHAAHLGHPVAGDEKYGDAAANKAFRALGLKRMFLHASALSMPHPNGDTLSVSAPLPPELREVLDALERRR